MKSFLKEDCSVEKNQGDEVFRVHWGATLGRLDREHPNMDFRFNSVAIVETAVVDIELNEGQTGILLHVSHPDYKGGMYGNVFINGQEESKALAEFVSQRKGKTVEQVASEVRESGLFDPQSFIIPPGGD
jgi:hypothetical protein